jgi:uncharacterized protein (DUF2141 family)
LSLRIGTAAALFLVALLGPAPAAEAQAAPACGGPPGPVRFYVTVDRIQASRGLVAVTVYGDNPKKFLARLGALYVVRVPARAPRTRVCINLPSTGGYAFAAYHDADADRGFDKNGVGLPAEDFGFSNNPVLLFGPPSFSKVRVTVPRTSTGITVRLRKV